jgi:hypothetical protein
MEITYSPACYLHGYVPVNRDQAYPTGGSRIALIKRAVLTCIAGGCPAYVPSQHLPATPAGLFTSQAARYAFRVYGLAGYGSGHSYPQLADSFITVGRNGPEGEVYVFRTVAAATTAAAAEHATGRCVSQHRNVVLSIQHCNPKSVPGLHFNLTKDALRCIPWNCVSLPARLLPGGVVKQLAKTSNQ